MLGNKIGYKYNYTKVVLIPKYHRNYTINYDGIVK